MSNRPLSSPPALPARRGPSRSGPARRAPVLRAVLTGLVLAGLTSGCGDDDPPVRVDPKPVASVTVTPDAGELSLGTIVQLSATARDADGATLTDRAITWSSSDGAVASVSSTGVVRGESPGQATIRATAENVSGAAEFDVVIPNLVVTGDTSLVGELTVDSVRIAAGATVTLAGDVTLRAGGPVEIAGDVTGNCAALVVDSDADIVVTGDIDNACAVIPAGEAPGITLAATGMLSLDGVEMKTSGSVNLTNDETLMEDEFNAFAYSEGPVSVPGFEQNSGFACIARDYRFVPDPARAPDGANGGATGGHGTDGSTWRLGCRGDGLLENVQVFGQGGGDGGRGEDQSAGDVTVRGGDGGDGGLLRARVTGSLTIRGEGTEFESGDGGQGGPARAEPSANPAGATAPSADATGGDGGSPGLLDVWALGGISVLDAGVVARIGTGGEGGLAFAQGADGASADARNDVAQAGGNAAAYGGDGAGTPEAQLRVVGPSVAANLILEGGDAGAGGNAESVGGRGGDGSALHQTGGAGGAMHVVGGFGGDAETRAPAGQRIGAGGNAGYAFFEGGRGGDGWDECRPFLLPGGFGGPGGSITGSDGVYGTGATDGVIGDLVIADGTGDGGAGGDGVGPGTGGAGGSEQVTVNGQRVAGAAFRRGATGVLCVIPQLLQPIVDLGTVLGDPNLFWAWLLDPPNQGPIPHPSPLIPAQPRPDDETGVHRIASVLLDLDAEQAAALDAAYPCGDRSGGWTRSPGPEGAPLVVSGCDQGGGQTGPGRYYAYVAALRKAIRSNTSEHFSYVMALDADGDPANNYRVTPGFENDPYVGTDRFYEMNHTPGQGWRMVAVDARNTQPVEIATGGRGIVQGNMLLMLVPASEIAASSPGIRLVTFRHQGEFGLQGQPWSMDVQPAPAQAPPFIPTVSIPPATTPPGS